MAKSIRISDDLYAMAQKTSEALCRPLAQQMEYWARLGAAIDAAGVSSEIAMDLLGRGASADEFVAAALGHGAPVDGGLPLLKEGQRKDAEDVAAGRRSARSLWAFQPGDLDGYTFTPNPASEYEKPGEGWCCYQAPAPPSARSRHMEQIPQLMDVDELALAIGQNIRLARVGKRWPQEELCARSGVSLKALKNLEAGRKVEMKTFLGVAKALGMIDQVLANTEPQPTTLDELERIELARTTTVRTLQP